MKQLDWSNEREWRVVTYDSDAATGDFTDMPMSPSGIVGVYIGYQAAKDEVQELLSALS